MRPYLLLLLLMLGVVLIVAGCVAPFVFNSLWYPAALCAAGTACTVAASLA